MKDNYSGYGASWRNIKQVFIGYGNPGVLKSIQLDLRYCYPSRDECRSLIGNMKSMMPLKKALEVKHLHVKILS
jgi:hypothetical protein